MPLITRSASLPPRLRRLPPAQARQTLAALGAATRRLLIRWDRGVGWPVLGGCGLALLYMQRYVEFFALPGNVPGHPEGWWGWFDQSKYIESARAFAAFDFAPARHWYPLGYSLMGAPFIGLSPQHPFMLVDLLSLLACYAGFLAFARRLGVGPGWSVLIFAVSVAGSRTLFAQWIVPWNTSPVSALIWALLASVAAHMQGSRRPVLIGLLAACLPLIRPTEALLAGLCVLAGAASDVRQAPRYVARALLGGLLPVLPYALLHWRIYGLAASDYMLNSRDIGFTLHGLAWKAYVVLVDPRAWFLDGDGLLRGAPFMALAVAGLAVAFAHGRAAILLALLLVVHTVLYLAYVDLLPTGLWRYMNVHYWSWTFPGAGLLAFLLVRDLLRWRRARAFPLAPLAFAVSLPLLCLQLVPVPVADTAPAKMLVYSGQTPGFDQSYFAPLLLRDSKGPMRSVVDLRAIPVPFGLRVFALTRDFAADPVWRTPPLGWVETQPPSRFAARLRIGLPCWMPGIRCLKAGNDQLPSPPKS